MEPDAFETLRWSLEDGVGRLVLDRPEKHNALSETVLSELTAAFEAFERRDRAADGLAVRVVVVEGAGDEAFSAGADISEFGDHGYPHVDATWWDAFETMADYGAPVVAKIDGYCLGGGVELALTFDFRIASARSTFGFPEVDIGMFPTGGGTQRLPRVVGRDRAKELLMTGERIDAETAEADGLLTAVHPTGSFDDEVAEFVDTLASKPPLALRAVKETVDKTAELNLSEGLDFERRTAVPVYESADYAEGLAAWDEDREPNWEGR
ncbi:MAG: enoyl-CoA hydratase/isomerase family protein [Halolamina sp.]